MRARVTASEGHPGENLFRTLERSVLGAGLSAALACTPAVPPVEIELIREPVTLSREPRSFSAAEPLRADGRSIGVCVVPDQGYTVSGRWTVLTPGGQDVQVVARAELVNGRVVKLASPTSTGFRLCVHPRLGGPLEAPVRRVHLSVSAPIVVKGVLWQSTDEDDSGFDWMGP